MAPVHFTIILLLFPTFAFADSLHLPLIRRSRHSLDYNKAAYNTRRKYGFPTSTSSHRSSRRAAAAVGLPILNQDDDASYIASLAIGTPPQQFDIVLDTGSSDLWLSGVNCPTCTRGSPTFDTSKSSTFSSETSSASSAETTISYGSGEVRGTLGSDTVTMGDFTITGQTLLIVDAMTSGLAEAPVSGLMGLAFQSLASTGALPFWQALISDNLLSAPEMSFWLTRDSDLSNPSNLDAGGLFTLGGTNSSLFTGDIQFIDLAGEPSFWTLSMSSLTVNGTAITISTGNDALSAIDTGTTLIGGPTADVAAIYAAIPNSAPSANSAGFYTFPCDAEISVSMGFGGGNLWPINPVDMNIGQDAQGSTLCRGAIFDLSQGVDLPPDQGSPGWVVGDTFLKNVYSVFRSSSSTSNSVGFAQLSAAAGGSGAGASPLASGSSLLTPSTTLLTPVTFTTSILGSPTAGSGISTGSSSGSGSGSSTSGVTTNTASVFVMFSTAFAAVILLCL